jgi:hypothetical protein
MDTDRARNIAIDALDKHYEGTDTSAEALAEALKQVIYHLRIGA